MRKPRLKEDDALAVVSVSEEQELKQKEREKKKGRGLGMGLCPSRAKSANPPYFASLKIKHPMLYWFNGWKQTGERA